MRGHEDVIKKRIATRLKPTAIFLNDYECKHVGYDNTWGTTMPEVEIVDDNIATLDLRFVVGCMVSGNGSTKERAQALFNRLITFNPIVCAVHELTNNENKGQTWLGYYTQEQGVIYG